MNINIDIPEYNSSSGFRYKWEDNFIIHVNNTDDFIHIKANKEGLLSLANHLLNLAQDEIPVPYHIHLNEGNYSLEKGSKELIIEKI